MKHPIQLRTNKRHANIYTILIFSQKYQSYLIVKSRILVPTLVGSVQFGDNFRGFDAGIFRESPGNDLQRLGKFLDSVLFKACTCLGENITSQLARISKISR